MNKKLIVFDLDWTLWISKSPIDSQMAQLLWALVEKYYVAIISWWDFPQYQENVISKLNLPDSLLQKFFLCPTCWAKMYVYKNWNWEKIYSEEFSPNQRDTIIKILDDVLHQTWYKEKEVYWDMVEDRWTQITFMAMWSLAPLEVKSKWDPDFKKRAKIKTLLDQNLDWVSVTMSWTSSIDITKKWIDKAYGIIKLKEITWIDIDEMFFVWDALFEWWNDYPVKLMWVECKQVDNLDQTKVIINDLIR